VFKDLSFDVETFRTLTLSGKRFASELILVVLRFSITAICAALEKLLFSMENPALS
jgi:hypothetical protein